MKMQPIEGKIFENDMSNKGLICGDFPGSPVVNWLRL